MPKFLSFLEFASLFSARSAGNVAAIGLVVCYVDIWNRGIFKVSDLEQVMSRPSRSDEYYRQ
jgi:hypothetical protein